MAYISTEQAAARLGISPVTLRVQASKGVLHPKRISPRRLVFDEEEIARYGRERKGKFGAASPSRTLPKKDVEPALIALIEAFVDTTDTEQDIDDGFDLHRALLQKYLEKFAKDDPERDEFDRQVNRIWKEVTTHLIAVFDGMEQLTNLRQNRNRQDNTSSAKARTRTHQAADNTATGRAKTRKRLTQQSARGKIKTLIERDEGKELLADIDEMQRILRANAAPERAEKYSRAIEALRRVTLEEINTAIGEQRPVEGSPKR